MVSALAKKYTAVSILVLARTYVSFAFHLIRQLLFCYYNETDYTGMLGGWVLAGISDECVKTKHSSSK